MSAVNIKELTETQAITDISRTAWICSQCFFVIRQGKLVVFLVIGDASLSQKRGNIVWLLIEDKIKLCVCLVHFVTLVEAKVGAAKQMPWVVHVDLVSVNVVLCSLGKKLTFPFALLLLCCKLHIVRSKTIEHIHLQ
jgi:hypothetical protein